MAATGTVPLPLRTPRGTRYFVQVLLSLPAELSETMPPEALRHRCERWLGDGADAIDAELAGGGLEALREVPVLVVAGGGDVFLPSVSEAERLRAALPRCRVVVVPDAGHAYTMCDKLDLAKEIAAAVG